MGVYLAGYVGFQRTLEYERFVKAQQRSERLTALHEELKQNVVRLLKFNERLPADVGNNVHDPDWPHLLLFVWQAAGRSVSAADIPPQIVIDRTQFRERLENHMKFAEASIFPAMDEATNASVELLKKIRFEVIRAAGNQRDTADDGTRRRLRGRAHVRLSA